YAGGSWQQLATSSLAINTNNLIEGNTNLFYTDARVNAYIHASTTIPRTYTANTFTALQTFGNASTSVLSVSGVASTSALDVSSLNAANCDVKASAFGVLSCGTDVASPFAFPYTPGTSYSQQVNSTSTPIAFTAGIFA